MEAGPVDGAAHDDKAQRQQVEQRDKAERVLRDGLGRWIEGQSGNPRGRPPVLRTVRELAREHTELAVRTLAEIARDRTLHPAARIVAARELLDRGHGRASPVELVQDLALVSDEELDRLAQAEQREALRHDPGDLGGSGASLLSALPDEALDALEDEP